VTITDDNGCTGMAEVEVEVIENQIVVPNAFSPNGDGANDIFIIRYLENIATYQMKVFNRWGDLVFASNDKDSGWDGTYLGKEQEIEAYIYVVQYTTTEGFDSSMKGTVTLLK
jgi:gliding motility-associated-like protein